jgi:hypothetical protein
VTLVTLMLLTLSGIVFFFVGAVLRDWFIHDER